MGGTFTVGGGIMVPDYTYFIGGADVCIKNILKCEMDGKCSDCKYSECGGIQDDEL